MIRLWSKNNKFTSFRELQIHTYFSISVEAKTSVIMHDTAHRGLRQTDQVKINTISMKQKDFNWPEPKNEK